MGNVHIRWGTMDGSKWHSDTPQDRPGGGAAPPTWCLSARTLQTHDASEFETRIVNEIDNVDKLYEELSQGKSKVLNGSGQNWVLADGSPQVE